MPFIIPADADECAELAVALLAAAGDHPRRIQTFTSGPHLGFDVDADLAAAIGYGTPAADPVSPAASPKSSTRKAKTGPSGDVTEGDS